jgi:hypothetical protein
MQVMTQIGKASSVALFAAAVAATATIGAAQDHKDHQMTVGQGVTLTACVEKAQKADSFILTNVADMPVHPATMGRVVYWLNDVKPLRAHVGHQIRVMGTITEVKQGEIEIKAGDDGQGGLNVEIEGPGRDVRTTATKAGVSSAGQTPGKNDIKTTLVKLKVSDVTMVAASCPPK